MAYLQLRDRVLPLPEGASTIGADGGATIRVPEAVGRGAILVEVGGDGMTLRRGTIDGPLTVNGVAVDAAPVPLLHGDRIEWGGVTLRIGSGAPARQTSVLSVPAVAADASVPPVTSAPGVRLVEGRLVSLVDGREYPVPDHGLVLGRDADCDLVITSVDASRRHARLARVDGVYELTDTSANGAWVNGERVVGVRRLVRGDVVRVADEAFRFTAEAEVGADGAAAGDVPLARLTFVAPSAVEGTQLELMGAVARIGSADDNDIVIRDAGIAATHLVLERRANGWFIDDRGAEGGTFVDGHRLEEPRRLTPTSEVRLGDVMLRFTPMAGTRAVAADPVGA